MQEIPLEVLWDLAASQSINTVHTGQSGDEHTAKKQNQGRLPIGF